MNGTGYINGNWHRWEVSLLEWLVEVGEDSYTITSQIILARVDNYIRKKDDINLSVSKFNHFSAMKNYAWIENWAESLTPFQTAWRFFVSTQHRAAEAVITLRLNLNSQLASDWMTIGDIID